MELLDTSSIAPPDTKPNPVRRRPRNPRPPSGNQGHAPTPSPEPTPVFKDQTDQLLHGLIQGDTQFEETLQLEFKQFRELTSKHYDWLAKEVAAMLNTRGGKIILGVEDKSSEVTGVGDLLSWVRKKKPNVDVYEHLRGQFSNQIGKVRLGDKGLFAGSVQMKRYTVLEREFIVLNVELFTGESPIAVTPQSCEKMKNDFNKLDKYLIYERREEEAELIRTPKAWESFKNRWKNRTMR